LGEGLGLTLPLPLGEGLGERPPLFLLNCGGDAYTDRQGNVWQADDSLLSHSWGQDFAGIHPYQASQRHLCTDINGTYDDPLFQSFRFGRHRLWYDLPVPSDTLLYDIDLYFMEPWHGRDDYSEDADYEGLRIFDVAVNDSLVIDDLDPWAEAGYATPFCRTVTARAKDGRLHISFPEVKVGQAVICAIAVRANNYEGTGWPMNVTKQPAGNVWLSLDTDTIARLPKDELPQDSEARPATVYTPQQSQRSQVSQQSQRSQKPQSSQNSQKPQPPHTTTFIITPGLGQEYAMRFRYKNTTGQSVVGRLRLTDAKNVVLIDRPITFPATPDKFKMLSTTTGTQINAGTYILTIEADSLEFKEMELQ